MTYYLLEPEVAGSILGENSMVDVSVRPPRVSHLDYEFNGWPDDDLITSLAHYIVTTRLKDALVALTPTGCEFAPVEISKSEQFEEMYPEQELPEFAWLKINGQAGVDDFGMSDDHRLVVSKRILHCLKQFKINNCDTEVYSPQEQLVGASTRVRKVV
jgi:hypothetical protein